MRTLKIVSIFCLAICLILAATIIVSAQTGSNWSEPIIVATGDEGHSPTDPEIFGGAGGDGLWATYEPYPTAVVLRSGDGQSWEKVAEWETESGFFDGTQPLTVTHDAFFGCEVLQMTSVIINHSDGNYQNLYTAEVGYSEQMTYGGYSITPLAPFSTYGRHDAVRDSAAYHIAWRNYPDGEVLYARGEPWEGWHPGVGQWSIPITVTSEFDQGTAPALWVRGDKIVILIDDTSANWVAGLETHVFCPVSPKTWAFVSDDGGKSWEKSFVGEGYGPELIETQDKLVALLYKVGSAMNDTMETYVSGDSGKTWGGPYPIPNVAGYPEEHQLSVRADDGMLALVWTDDQRIWATFSDNGRDWLAPEVVYGSEGTNTQPSVTFWKDRVYIVWYSSESDQPERILVSKRPAPSIHRIYLPIILGNFGS